MRTILHVDMDAFYASVEQRDAPELRGKPVIVGGSARRGVVCAASYEARPFGVRSAMPVAEALRRCPGAVVVAPRHGRYAAVSREVFRIFHRYTPLVEGLSLDEAFLDVTASRGLFGDGPAIARAIKDAVRRELDLTASAGVAPCKFVAKVASDLGKPDGLVVVPADVAAFLAPLPIERMWGVGPKTAPRLRALGYGTLGALSAANRDELGRLFGAWGETMHALARGVDDRAVTADRKAKSIGSEETHERDLTSMEELHRALLVHADRVAQRLLASGCSAHTVVLKIKLADFTLLSRRARLPEPVVDSDSLRRAALALMERLPLERARVRLTGIAATDLQEGPPPRTLFPDAAVERSRKVDALMAKVASRVGPGGLTRAALLPRAAPAGRGGGTPGDA